MGNTERELEVFPWLSSRRDIDRRLYWWAYTLTNDHYQSASNSLPLIDMVWQLIYELRLIQRSKHSDLLLWGEPFKTTDPDEHPLYLVALQKLVSMTPMIIDRAAINGATWEAAYEACKGVVGAIEHADGCDGFCAEGLNGIACLNLRPGRIHRPSPLHQ